MPSVPDFTDEQLAAARRYASLAPPRDTIDPRIATLVNELIGRVADKWTMLIIEVLAERGDMRFTRIGESVPGISQKMLTQTLRQMERDGLLKRTVYPVVPPKVEYRLTHLGMTLSAAFCGVWVWAAENLKEVERARRAFDKKVNKAQEQAGRTRQAQASIAKGAVAEYVGRNRGAF
jgi:DNA-binding HxlR family transcriptional regulator